MLQPQKENLATKLGEFFTRLVDCAPFGNGTAGKSRVLDPVVLDGFFATLDPVITKARSSGAFVNVWEVAGLGCDELRNSRVLAWFLSQRAEHGLGNSLMAALVKRCRELAGAETGAFPSVINDGRYTTIIESCPFGEKESRVDIELDGDEFLLFVEVKINAPETGNQLDRYVALARKKSNGRPWGVVFLTPTGKSPNENKSTEGLALNCNELLCMSWNEVSKVFFNVADRLDAGLVKSLLVQYASFVKKF